MRITDVTLIFCNDPAQKEQIDAFLSDCGIPADGMAYCDGTDKDIGNQINRIRACEQVRVNFGKWRLIYILEDEASVRELPAFIEAFSSAAGTTPHVMHVIWKTDACSMEEVWPQIREVFSQTDQNAGRIKLSLISQSVNEGPILLGMHTQAAARLAVMSACGRFAAAGVYAYEIRRLNISENDIKNITESLVISRACSLAGQLYRENSEEEAAYQKSLWQTLFGEWSGRANGQLRLSDIDLTGVIRDRMPDATDFCVYAPKSYDSIHRAVEFFDRHNRERLIKRVSEDMLAAWKDNYRKAIERSPGMVNSDTCRYLKHLSVERIEEPSAHSSGRMDEPRPGLLGRTQFYMNRLQQAAADKLRTYYPEIETEFLKRLQAELACTVRQMERDVQENISRIRGSLCLTMEEIGTFSEAFVAPIRTEVDRQLRREAMTGSWEEAIGEWKRSVLRAIPDQDMISRLAGMDAQAPFNADEYMPSSGILLNIGSSNINPERSEKYALISQKIKDAAMIEKMTAACGVGGEYESVAINDVICLYEYRLTKHRIFANDDEARNADEHEEAQIGAVLPALRCYQEGSMKLRRGDGRSGQDNTFEAREAVPETEAQETEHEVQVVDSSRDNVWIFSLPEWRAAGELRAPLMVSVRMSGRAADGVRRRESCRDIPVGGGGSTDITVPKAGFDSRDDSYYGLCTVAFSWDQNRIRREVKVQGSKIVCSCLCRRRGRLAMGDGRILTSYSMNCARRRGEAVPLLDNAVTRAASYDGYLYYIETGADQLYVDADRRGQFELRSADDPELYLIELNFD